MPLPLCGAGRRQLRPPTAQATRWAQYRARIARSRLPPDTEMRHGKVRLPYELPHEYERDQMSTTTARHCEPWSKSSPSEEVIVNEHGERLDEMILENSGRPRPGPDYEPHHIDGDWLNNTRNNLEWRKRDEAIPSWLENRLSVMDEASSSIPLLVVGDYLADRVAEIAELVRLHVLPSHRHPVDDVSQPAWRAAFYVVDLLSKFMLEDHLASDDEGHDPEALYEVLQSVFLQLWLGRDKYDDPDPQNDLNDAGERGLAVVPRRDSPSTAHAC